MYEQEDDGVEERALARQYLAFSCNISFPSTVNTHITVMLRNAMQSKAMCGCVSYIYARVAAAATA
jgi:hypothetical protein